MQLGTFFMLTNNSKSTVYEKKNMPRSRKSKKTIKTKGAVAARPFFSFRKSTKKRGRTTTGLTKRGHRTGNHAPGSSNQGKYPDVPKQLFCGPSGGAASGTYPVNTKGRYHAALAYSHYAPNPNGIRACATRIAKAKGWLSKTTTRKKTTRSKK